MAESNRYTVRVEGNTGRKFSGSCLVTGDGSSESKTVDGRVPGEFSYVGRSISCSFQKGTDETTAVLRVSLLRNGVTVKTVETQAEYGVVTFTG